MYTCTNACICSYTKDHTGVCKIIAHRATVSKPYNVAYLHWVSFFLTFTTSSNLQRWKTNRFKRSLVVQLFCIRQYTNIQNQTYANRHTRIIIASHGLVWCFWSMNVSYADKHTYAHITTVPDRWCLSSWSMNVYAHKHPYAHNITVPHGRCWGY